MLLLQKLTGIDFVKAAFDANEDGENKREWYIGYHRYSSVDDVIKRYCQGQPISCVRSEDGNSFHVALYAKDTTMVNYLTFEPRPLVMTTKEFGIHFCNFIVRKEDGGSNKTMVRTMTKASFKQKFADYALMLPYRRDGESFHKKFTLIYHDWDVLLCHNGIAKKGAPVPDSSVFSEVLPYLQLLE
jgi:hypothetical protein